MKMPRSHCEYENVQIVQDLAEVDGPFESPININFRDLTKLELPSLVWNHSETCPKKMKITNTGHTVIVSGKWKCERPYLTGGPLIGKYVFSQIHFHWGQDDCKGSEHQVCGENFPLEMHVAHFKTEYLTQESALKEKDGMVVVVYLFKEEPNASIKKILAVLPQVKQAGTSYDIEARPIRSLCNTFSDDYFMYWGSVVTSTCAHILLWIICREPFGISRDQVNEFRKILDISEQPIYRNNRQTQPLHKRNVFHVNASKNICNPMLPIKNLVGCYCKKSEESVIKSQPFDCSCQAYLRNQEEIEGKNADCRTGYLYNKDTNYNKKPPRNFFVHNSIVTNTTVPRVPLLPRRLKSIDIGQVFYLNSKQQEKLLIKKNGKLATKSCCFFSINDVKKGKGRIDKSSLIRDDKKFFTSIKPFSHIMDSLEALKCQTMKKLKKIESINQEIKKIKPASHKAEDKRWFTKFEKIMSKQKQYTIKTSEGYFNELKNLARECNKFEKVYNSKELLTDKNIQKTIHLNTKILMERALPCSDICMNENQEGLVLETKTGPPLVEKHYDNSSKMQRLIQKLFEDIKETEDFQQTISNKFYVNKIKFSKIPSKENLTLAKNLCHSHTEHKIVSSGNLNQFFTEVVTDNMNISSNEWKSKNDPKTFLVPSKNNSAGNLSEKNYKITYEKNEEKTTKILDTYSIPLHKASKALELSKSIESKQHNELQNILQPDNLILSEEPKFSGQNHKSYHPSTSNREIMPIIHKHYESNFKKFPPTQQIMSSEQFLKKAHYSSSSISAYSIQTQRMIIAKLHKKHFKENKMPLIVKIPSEELYKARLIKHKIRNLNLKGYYIKKKKIRSKRNFKNKGNMEKIYSFDDTSSSYKSSIKKQLSKSKWKYLKKTKFRIQMEKTTDTTTGSEYVLISPKRKKIKLECKKQKTLKGIPIFNDNNENSYSDSDEKFSSIKKFNPYIKNKKRKNIYIIRRDIPNNIPNSTIKYNTMHLKSKIKASVRTTPKPWRKMSVFRRNTYTTKTHTTESVKTSSEDSFTCFPEKKTTKNRDKKPTIIKIEPEETLIESELENKNLSKLTITRGDHLSGTSSGISAKKQNIPSQQSKQNAKIIFIKTVKTNSKKSLTESDGETEKKEHNIFQTTEPDDAKISKTNEYRIGFFNTTSDQIHKPDLIKETQFDEKYKNLLEPITADKETFLTAAETFKSESYINPKEFSTKSEINKAIPDTNIIMKESSNFLSRDSKKLQTSISYSSVLKSPLNRPYSAESLNPVKQVCKRKRRKKRPYCCKRNSKHYIRKNFSGFKKMKKSESKFINTLKLTQEQKLHIIFLNAVKYLKDTLVNKIRLDPEQNVSFSEIEQIILKDMTILEEEKKQISVKPTKQKLVSSKIFETDNIKQEEESEKPKNTETKVEKQLEKEDAEKIDIPTNIDKKTEVNKIPEFNEGKKYKLKILKEAPEKNFTGITKIPCLLKSKNNSIKQNKIMTGRYKKQMQTVENSRDSKPQKNNASTQRKENFSVLQQEHQLKTFPDSKTRAKPKPLAKPKNLKLSNELKVKTKSKNTNLDKNNDQQNYVTVENEKISEDENKKNKKKAIPSALVLKKKPSTSTRWLPAYMMTSYPPTCIEIVENQQREMNKFLFNMKGKQIGGYSPRLVYDSYDDQKNFEEKKKESILIKDLEYLMRLQTYLNNEVSENIENSMKYVKTLFNPNDNVTTNTEIPCVNDTMNFSEPFTKGLIFIEMEKFLEHPTSDYRDGSGQQIFCTNSTTTAINSIINIEKLKESGDPGIINRSVINQKEDRIDYNSDSSYNCEISITLNTSTNEEESEIQVHHPINYYEENSSKYIYELGKSSSQTTTQPDTCSSSQSVKLNRRKRKENEISVDMKQKLLEILEGEIRREMEICYGSSSETSSNSTSQKWDELNLKTQSQNMDSSSDNMEVSHQISETVKKYISNYNDKLFFPKISENPKSEQSHQNNLNI